MYFHFSFYQHCLAASSILYNVENCNLSSHFFILMFIYSFLVYLHPSFMQKLI